MVEAIAFPRLKLHTPRSMITRFVSRNSIFTQGTLSSGLPFAFGTNMASPCGTAVALMTVSVIVDVEQYEYDCIILARRSFTVLDRVFVCRPQSANSRYSSDVQQTTSYIDDKKHYEITCRQV